MPDEPSDEELGAKLRAAFGNPEEPEEVDPDPHEKRLAEIEERAGRIRANNPLPEPPEWTLKPIGKGPKSVVNENYRDLGFGLSVLYALVGPFLAGFAIGWLIDKRTGTSVGMFWGTILGAICGLGGAFFTAVKHERKSRP